MRWSPTTGATALAASAAAAALVLAAPSAAQATPPAGVSSTLIGQRTVGGTDLVLRRITIQPGGTTGWHWHDGTLYAVVESGTLTHQMADCTDVVHDRSGSSIVEHSGADEVHRGMNLGATPVVLDVLYVDPHGSPLSESAADPGCPTPPAG